MHIPLTIVYLAVISLQPSERPKGCDGSSCTGCTPFQPPEGSSKDYPCGINDVYFPVPIYGIRNDTSVGREVESRQWACFACCTLGCGFDDPQNTCTFTSPPPIIRPMLRLSVSYAITRPIRRVHQLWLEGGEQVWMHEVRREGCERQGGRCEDVIGRRVYLVALYDDHHTIRCVCPEGSRRADSAREPNALFPSSNRDPARDPTRDPGGPDALPSSLFYPSSLSRRDRNPDVPSITT